MSDTGRVGNNQTATYMTNQTPNTPETKPAETTGKAENTKGEQPSTYVNGDSIYQTSMQQSGVPATQEKINLMYTLLQDAKKLLNEQAVMFQEIFQQIQTGMPYIQPTEYNLPGINPNIKNNDLSDQIKNGELAPEKYIDAKKILEAKKGLLESNLSNANNNLYSAQSKLLENQRSKDPDSIDNNLTLKINTLQLEIDTLKSEINNNDMLLHLLNTRISTHNPKSQADEILEQMR